MPHSQLARYPGGRKTFDQPPHWSKVLISKPAPFWGDSGHQRGLQGIEIERLYGSTWSFLPVASILLCPTDYILWSVLKFQDIQHWVGVFGWLRISRTLGVLKNSKERGGLGPLKILCWVIYHQSQGLGVSLDDLVPSPWLVYHWRQGILCQINERPSRRTISRQGTRLVQAFQYTDTHRRSVSCKLESWSQATIFPTQTQEKWNTSRRESFEERD